MKRKDIQLEHINEVLRLASRIIYSEEKNRSIQSSDEEYPFVHALLTENPESILRTFHTGSLLWDLERVAGLRWKWQVKERNGELQIRFSENKPAAEKSESELEEEHLLNQQVALYLLSVSV